MAAGKFRGASLGSLTAVSNGTGVSILDLDKAAVNVSGTFVGTWAVQVSFDGGTTYVNHTTGTTAQTVTITDALAGHVRLICSAYTSGTIVGYLGGRNLALNG